MEDYYNQFLTEQNSQKIQETKDQNEKDKIILEQENNEIGKYFQDLNSNQKSQNTNVDNLSIINKVEMDLIDSYLNSNSYNKYENDKELILDFEFHLNPNQKDLNIHSQQNFENFPLQINMDFFDEEENYFYFNNETKNQGLEDYQNKKINHIFPSIKIIRAENQMPQQNRINQKDLFLQLKQNENDQENQFQDSSDDDEEDQKKNYLSNKKLECSPLRKNIQKKRNSISSQNSNQSNNDNSLQNSFSISNENHNKIRTLSQNNTFLDEEFQGNKKYLQKNSIQENLREMLEKLNLNVDNLPEPFYPSEQGQEKLNQSNLSEEEQNQLIKTMKSKLPANFINEFDCDLYNLNKLDQFKNFDQLILNQKQNRTNFLNEPQVQQKLVRRYSDSFLNCKENNESVQYNIISHLERSQMNADADKKIGPLTIQERKLKLIKYLEKKKKSKIQKSICEGKKKFSDTRLRFKGRFVTKQQAQLITRKDLEGLNDDQIKEILNSKENDPESIQILFNFSSSKLTSEISVDSRSKDNDNDSIQQISEFYPSNSLKQQQNEQNFIREQNNPSILSLKEQEQDEFEYNQLYCAYRQQNQIMDNDNNKQDEVYFI